MTDPTDDCGPPTRLSRAQLDVALDNLAAWVPVMLLETDEASQMDAYAGEVEMIEEKVAAEDRDHFWSRSQCILRENGLIPGDDEPCAD